MGIPVTNPGSNRENCPKISTACVIWQGPDIPCIDLCAGDAIDEVVFKLATYLCELSQNIFDIDNINFSCLLPPGSERGDEPKNLEELIQLLINYSCGIDPVTFNSPLARTLLSGANVVGTSSMNEPILELPDGIAYFDENGDYITVLEQSKYVKVVATKLAEMILLTNNGQGRIFNAEKAIKNLEVNLKKLESSNSTSDIYVVSQCASSGTPGQQVLIQDAFTVFERNYCNLTTVIGTTTSLYNGINSQIPNLPNLPQLMNSSLQMKAIPTWSVSVNNVGASLTNLWLTISDMRNKIIEIANNTYDVPCILLSPENLELGTVNDSSATIYWEKTSVADVQVPTSYVVEVYEVSDTEFKKPLFTQTKSQIDNQTNTLTIASQNIEVNVEYIVHVSSMYKCGKSQPSMLKGVLKNPLVLFVVNPTIRNRDLTTSLCTTTEGTEKTYTPIETTISFELATKDGGVVVPNNTTTPLTIIARFKIISCEFTEPVYEDIEFEILPNESLSNEETYISSKLTNCANGSCGEWTKNLFCGVFISEPSVEFDSKYGNCN